MRAPSPPAAEVGYAIGDTSLGAILVAADAEGLVAILLGDDPSALNRDLQRRLPSARIAAVDGGLASALAKVRWLVEAPREGLDLPLAPRGTAFQQQVWRELRAVTCGETLSYTALAARMRLPHAVRAVAGACAANHLAVAIPCHRVVRSDGGLSGYAWGVERKRALLGREGATTLL